MSAGGDWGRFAEAPPEPWTPRQDAALPVHHRGDDAPPGTVDRGQDEPVGPRYGEPPGVDDLADAGQSDARRRESTADPAEEPGEGADQALIELAAELAAVRGELARLVAVNEQQAALVDRLHADNQALRRAETERQRDPVVRELIGLADTSLRTARDWADGDDPAAGPVAEALRGVADDIRLVLEHQGVESYAPGDGDPFDRRQHRAKGTRVTGNAELAERVAEVLRPGYLLGERVIRPAEVLVWQVDPAAAAHSAQQEDDSTAGAPAAGADTTDGATGVDPAPRVGDGEGSPLVGDPAENRSAAGQIA